MSELTTVFDYLDGKLSDEEAAAFEAELIRDEMAVLLADATLIREAVRAAGETSVSPACRAGRRGAGRSSKRLFVPPVAAAVVLAAFVLLLSPPVRSDSVAVDDASELLPIWVAMESEASSGLLDSRKRFEESVAISTIDEPSFDDGRSDALTTEVPDWMWAAVSAEERPAATPPGDVL